MWLTIHANRITQFVVNLYTIARRCIGNDDDEKRSMGFKILGQLSHREVNNIGLITRDPYTTDCGLRM